MIRVGFVLDFNNSGWTGGVNYFSNLLNTVAHSKLIQPVILTGVHVPQNVAAEFADIEIVKSVLVDRTSKLMLSRRVAEKLYGRAFILERLLKLHNIAVLSHSGHLGPRSRFPTVGWIPDFQYVHLPEFFSAADRSNRAGAFRRLADYCTRVIVSSETARQDLVNFRPQAAGKARVLHFVPGFRQLASELEPLEGLLARYRLETPYFYLPNQFWAHKNHAVVLSAMKLARAQGRRLTVVSTGNTDDYRNPGYFKLLMRQATESGCEDDFKVLGLVPFTDVASLMRHSVAVINPSLFEGWSTTVEEAKSMGKTIILSDIPVHREQAPEYGFFFDPFCPEQLADRMIVILDRYNPQTEAAATERALNGLSGRIATFANSFEAIVVDAIGLTP
jgi:glycosyltransferase involved in cell wall biosynthesis